MDDKSNEITAIPELLRLLTLEGCIVTIDAMGCQTKIAQQIIDENADYVLALKGNQGTLCRDAQDLFAYAQEINYEDIACDFHETVEKNHGRIEIRRHQVISEPEFIAYLNPNGAWAGFQSIGMVEAERQIGDEKIRFAFKPATVLKLWSKPS